MGPYSAMCRSISMTNSALKSPNSLLHEKQLLKQNFIFKKNIFSKNIFRKNISEKKMKNLKNLRKKHESCKNTKDSPRGVF